MKDHIIKTAVCGVFTTVIVAGWAVTAQAASYTAETPVAGVSVMLNQYYDRIGQDFTGQVPVAGAAIVLKDYYDNVTRTVSSKGMGTPVVAAGSVEDEAVDSGETQAEETSTAEETTVEPEKSEFDTIAVSRVNDYVNVRSEPNTESEVLGKIYDGCAATIVGVEGDWYKIDSGSIKGGYIKAEYFVTGAEAEALAEELATKYGVVNTTTLLVRAEPTTESDCITMVPLGEEFVIMEEQDNWAKIEVDASTTGWVSMDYLDCRVEFDTAISVEEEEAKIREQEEKEERAARAREALEEQEKKKSSTSSNNSSQSSSSNSSNSNSSSSNNSNSSQPPSNNEPETTKEVQAPVISDSSTSTLREAIVSYALQFVGYPYVYGGNSLTNGTDCSGFVKLIYQEFGYGLERRASLQYANNGRKISVDQIQPGDLIFYGNGEVDHVTMYIGNGQVVHASTEKTGIKISSVNYRTIYGAVSIVD